MMGAHYKIKLGKAWSALLLESRSIKMLSMIPHQVHRKTASLLLFITGLFEVLLRYK